MKAHESKDRQVGEAEYPLLLSGLDSLYVSHFLDTTASDLDWDALVYRREDARQSRRKVTEIELGSETFDLQPSGMHPYGIVLRNRSLEVRLAERMQPSCHVRYASEALWTEGLDRLDQRLRTWFASVRAIELRREVVSRADWAFDYGINTIDFDRDNFVTRADLDVAYRSKGKPQTFTLGKAQIVIRVYDKCAEIAQQSNKTWFHELWGRKEGVWRIEFQVRGERLRAAAIRTLDDVRILQNDLLREIATGHTSLRTASGDSNRSRWPYHGLWTQLLSDIECLPQTGLVRSYDPGSPLEYRLRKLAQSLYGGLRNIAAIESLRSDTDGALPFAALLERLPDILALEHSEPLWLADVLERMAAYRYGK